MERVDGLARGRVEREVEPRAGRERRLALGAQLDGEPVPAALDAVADGVVGGPHAHEAERAERRVVERGRAFEVGDAEREVGRARSECTCELRPSERAVDGDVRTLLVTTSVDTRWITCNVVPGSIA